MKDPPDPADEEGEEEHVRKITTSSEKTPCPRGKEITYNQANGASQRDSPEDVKKSPKF